MKAKFSLFVQYFFVLLFVYAAISKLITFEAFQVQLTQSPLLSAYATTIAYLVITVELIIALLIPIKTTKLIGLYLSYGLMVAFTIYIYLISNYSDFIPCSCGGILEKMGWREHLWFNIIVCVLGLAAIFIVDHNKLKIIVLRLVLITFSSFGIVILVLNLDKEVIVNNQIRRSYKEFVLERKQVVDLDYNSYYVAGIIGDSIVLGNHTAIKHILIYSISGKKLRPSSIVIPSSFKEDLKSLKLTVYKDNFYLYDNSSGKVIWGSTHDWIVKNVCDFKSVFNSFSINSGDKGIVRLYDKGLKTNVLGKIDMKTCSLDTISNVLNKKIDGLFDVDGQLLFDSKTDKSIYLFYYRNQYLNLELGNLLHPKLQHTIDTVAQVPLTFGITDSGKRKNLSHTFPKVNINGAYFNNYLLVKSNTIGLNETSKKLHNFSIYDVYQVEKDTYKFSFYLENYNKEEIKSLLFYNDLLIGLSEKRLIIYQIDLSYL